MKQSIFTLALLCLLWTTAQAEIPPTCNSCLQNTPCSLSRYDAPICAYNYADDSGEVKAKPKLFKTNFLNTRVDFNVTTALMTALSQNQPAPTTTIDLSFSGTTNITQNGITAITTDLTNLVAGDVISATFAGMGRYTVTCTYECDGSTETVPLDLIIKPNTTVATGYQDPDEIWLIETDRTWMPSHPEAYTQTRDADYLNDDVGNALAYVKLAEGHTALIKPLVLITGFDPMQTVITDSAIDGNEGIERAVIRYGNNGWDSFILGADEGFEDPLDPLDYETFRMYPQQFQDFSDLGYDLVIIDFERGGDYVQKNAILVEEVINRINDEKVADEFGVLHGNLVVGASMGGFCGRIALANMERNGVEHCTHTFGTFDTPMKGASIPLGVQAFAWHFFQNSAYNDKGQKQTWDFANTPAARQLAEHHLGTLVNDGTISVDYSLWVDEDSEVGAVAAAILVVSTVVSPIPNPIPWVISLIFDKHENIDIPAPFPDDYAILRTEMQQELDALGYPTQCRLAAIACGDATGAAQDFNAGDLLFEVEFSANGVANVLAARVNAVNGAFGDVCFNFPAEPNICPAADNAIYQAVVPAYQFNKAFGQVPEIFSYAAFTVNTPIPSMDNAPGAGRRDVLGVAEQFVSIAAGIDFVTANPNTPPGHEQQCFVPTMSAIDADISFEEGLGLDYATLVTGGFVETPFDRGEIYLLSPGNLKHVEIDSSMNAWLNGKLVAWEMFDNLILPNASGQRYNYNQDYRLLPSVTVNNNGELAINGGAGTMYGAGLPTSTSSFVKANTIFGCVESHIDVKDGGRMIIGTQDGNRRGSVTMNTGSSVHIRDGGTLRLTGSELIIEEGASLTIDAGANIDLFWEDARIVIKGELIINGDFNFDGLGYFDFYETNTLTLNGDGFNLTGEGKYNRFIKLNPFTELKIPAGKDLSLLYGQVELDNGAVGITVEHGAVDFTNVAVISPEGIPQHGVSIEYTNDVKFLNCDFDKLGQAIAIETLDKSTAFEFNYNNIENIVIGGLLIENANQNVLFISNSSFKGPVIGDHGISLSNVKTAYIGNTQIEVTEAKPFESKANGIYMGGVNQLMVGASRITNFKVGINGSSSVHKNNVSLIAGTGIYDCEKGVSINGGLDGSSKADWGRVTMDCAKLVNNKVGIHGKDVFLDIDAYMHCACPAGDPYLQPNTFIKDNGYGYLFFEICYQQRDDIELVSATGNHWQTVGNNPANNPDYIVQYNFCGIAGGTDIPVDQSLPIDIAPQGCVNPPNEPGDPSPGPGNDVKSCLDNGVISVNSDVNGDMVNAAYKFSSGDYEDALEIFYPVATISDGVRDDLDQLCRDRIDVARTYIHGVDEDDDKKTKMRTMEEAAYNQLQENRANELANGITMYPNPANQSIMIDMEHTANRIEVYNGFGQLIYTYSLGEGQTKYKVETSEWREGVYIAKFIFDENLRAISKKIMVMH